MRWNLWYFKWPYITTRKIATRLCSAGCSSYLEQRQMTTFIVTFCLRYSNVLLPSILFFQCYSCSKLISDSNGTTNSSRLSSEVKQGMIKSLSLNWAKIARKWINAKLWWTIKIINCIRNKRCKLWINKYFQFKCMKVSVKSLCRPWRQLGMLSIAVFIHNFSATEVYS